MTGEPEDACLHLHRRLVCTACGLPSVRQPDAADELARWGAVGDLLERILSRCLTGQRLLEQVLADTRNAFDAELVGILQQHVIGGIDSDATAACEFVTAVERAAGGRGRARSDATGEATS